LKIRAPAKINLALHVTGQRPDGYHLIESLVTFADAGDEISIEPSDRDRLTFSGQFGGMLAANFGTNLIIKALDAMRAAAQGRRCPPVAIHLEKNLPLASGIGGGSADAAAALTGLNEFWGLGLSQAELMRIGLPLGADVPMCIYGKPLIAKGIGEIIEPVALPELPMVLVNPGVGVSTPAIFKALVEKENEALIIRLALPNGRSEIHALVEYLRTTRNDLEVPARAIQPVIRDVISALEKSGALFARMSGSGATCFGIFADKAAAKSAKASFGKSQPDWWIA
jgi:4-diphosphocytidyl-2-C-methyl-D-erythritol kinase